MIEIGPTSDHSKDSNDSVAQQPNLYALHLTLGSLTVTPFARGVPEVAPSGPSFEEDSKLTCRGLFD